MLTRVIQESFTMHLPTHTTHSWVEGYGSDKVYVLEATQTLFARNVPQPVRGGRRYHNTQLMLLYIEMSACSFKPRGDGSPETFYAKVKTGVC